MIGPEELLERVSAFIEERGGTPTRFGLDAVGDPGFVSGLKKGREPRRRTIAKVIEFMESCDPDYAPKAKQGKAA